MLTIVAESLEQWAKPGSGVGCIVIKGTGGKAFCSGGDVKDVVSKAVTGQTSHGETFFTVEYGLNGRYVTLALSPWGSQP
jgi:enoyl-CoA hydratase/carnithine racemase